MWASFFRSRHLIISHSETDYATTLRGIAALMVFFLHGNFFAPFLSISQDLGFGTLQIQNLSNLGGAGPAAFFVASGFVLSLVWSKSKTAGFLKFAVRRYVRLMPLYLVILVIFSLSDYRDGRQSIEIFSELISRALFLEVFSYEQFSTLPMAVMWTIGVEFWLSMTIPVLVKLFSLRRYSYLVLFLSLSISFLGPIILIKLGVNDVMAWKSVLACFASFALGVFVSTFKPSAEANAAFKFFTIIVVLFLVMYIWSGFMGAWWVTLLMSICFLGLNVTAARILPQSDFLLWLGTVCYGVYLLHIPLLQITSKLSTDYAAPLAFLLLMPLSSISWLFVERPVILFFNKKLKKSRRILR